MGQLAASQLTERGRIESGRGSLTGSGYEIGQLTGEERRGPVDHVGSLGVRTTTRGLVDRRRRQILHQLTPKGLGDGVSRGTPGQLTLRGTRVFRPVDLGAV